MVGGKDEFQYPINNQYLNTAIHSVLVFDYKLDMLETCLLGMFHVFDVFDDTSICIQVRWPLRLIEMHDHTHYSDVAY